MPRYWVIAPIESNFPDFDKVWQFDVANNLISIGWGNLGDVSKMSREALSNAVVAGFPDKRPSDVVNMLWAFYHEIGIGDFVIARRGRKILAAAGKVVRAGFYAPGRNPFIASGGHFHHNFLEVEWQAQPRDKVFETLVFRMHTLAKIDEDQYHKLLGDRLVPDEQSYGIEATAIVSFDDHVAYADPPIRPVLRELRARITALDSAGRRIEEKVTAHQRVTYKVNRIFLEIKIQRNRVLIRFFGMEIPDPRNLVTNIPPTYGWAHDKQIAIDSVDLIDYAMPFVEASCRSTQYAAPELAEPLPAPKAPPAVDTSKVRKFGEGLQSVYVYGYVFAPDRLKIGKSEGDPVKRIASQITTATPGKPTVYLIFHTDDCHNLEKALHRVLNFRKQKVAGGGDEWFHTNCEELIEIYRFCVAGSVRNAELDDGSGPAPAG